MEDEVFIPQIEDNERKNVPIYKSVKVIELSNGQIFYNGDRTKLKIIEHSKTGKSVKYSAENGFTSILKANTIVCIET